MPRNRHGRICSENRLNLYLGVKLSQQWSAGKGLWREESLRASRENRLCTSWNVQTQQVHGWPLVNTRIPAWRRTKHPRVYIPCFLCVCLHIPELLPAQMWHSCLHVCENIHIQIEEPMPGGPPASDFLKQSSLIPNWSAADVPVWIRTGGVRGSTWKSETSAEACLISHGWACKSELAITQWISKQK